ncbi:MAG: hypothetical protein ACREOM_13620, partial [Candidatus Dormibacteraceae bacterium]
MSSAAVRVVATPTASADSIVADVLAVPVTAGATTDPELASLDPEAASFVASGEHSGRLHETLLLPGGTRLATR